MQPTSPLNGSTLAQCASRAKFSFVDPLPADWERFAAQVNELLVPAPDGPNLRKLIETWKRRNWAETQSATEIARYMMGEIEHALAADAQTKL
jgi:hypothetical protein